LGLRFNAAVDRLTGATERHSVACLEFRPGAGLWAIVRFADQAARDRWLDPVKTAFRLLADSGFGGERSLGWGRAEMPEFTEGTFPEMILAPQAAQSLPEPPPADVEQAILSPANSEQLTGPEAGPIEQALPTDDPVGQELPPASASTDEPVSNDQPAAGPQPPFPDPQSLIPEKAPEPQPLVPAAAPPQPHWLLSLFTPASTDSIDWSRGNYTLLIRCGRVEAPTRSGDLKRHLQMVAEGSVLYASSALRGSAPDVAPEGFAHPVFRAGFAVSIPLPESTGVGQAIPGAAPPAAKVS
jgi:hypothetical protein